MDNGYIVRFIRKDEKADEEYYYLAYGDALSHLALFKNDVMILDYTKELKS